MPNKKQIQNMLFTMNVRELREISKYFGVPVPKQSGGYLNKNRLVDGLVGGTALTSNYSPEEFEYLNSFDENDHVNRDKYHDERALYYKLLEAIKVAPATAANNGTPFDAFAAHHAASAQRAHDLFIKYKQIFNRYSTNEYKTPTKEQLVHIKQLLNNHTIKSRNVFMVIHYAMSNNLNMNFVHDLIHLDEMTRMGYDGRTAAAHYDSTQSLNQWEQQRARVLKQQNPAPQLPRRRRMMQISSRPHPWSDAF